MKRCTRCGKVKPLDEFYRHPDTRDGRQSYCRECNRAVVRAHAARNAARHPSEIPTPPEFKHCPDCDRTLPGSSFGRARRRSDGLQWICRECAHARRRDYYAANRERELEASRDGWKKIAGYWEQGIGRISETGNKLQVKSGFASEDVRKQACVEEQDEAGR